MRFFQHPRYLRNGNLFWPDAWADLVNPMAYEIFGLNYDVAKVRTDSLWTDCQVCILRAAGCAVPACGWCCIARNHTAACS